MKTPFRFLLGCLAALLTMSATASAQKIVIKGSDTLGAKLVPILAEEFKAKHPGVSFEIAAEGSSTGIAAIIDGTADIGMSSRNAKPTEMSAASAKGVDMTEHIVAYDGLAVIVNADSPLSNLRKRHVEQIFTGAVTDWAAVGANPGPISVYTRNTSSGTYSDFKALAMRKRDYARSSQKMAGNEQIASEVAGNSNGIGYVGLAYASAPGVKVVTIDGHLPEAASVNSGDYPYARPTFYYTNGKPTGIVAEFLAFTVSPEGQKIAAQVGFVPLAN
ncbi:phosphate ABC transporter substrate-binding protein [Synoicihabitans lomoniglobus]|uniref:Phosphate-binding protein n=1 Tax=Synoicihabitans lomoniglobus TaxID=2909285 RepID=A0AAF0CQF2_9BACT|nr:phosphate ABC transporter substrate-binding protein [Opitutaceae bacterium LMO-M01]WED66111.1 phosphate ABC transporter substrate-binding protein [Opitutaceae bacterium LMO-M01]